MAGFLSARISSNPSNDYFGYKRGDDTPDSPRMRYTLHPLAHRIMKPAALATGLLVPIVTGAAIAAFFAAQRGWLAGGFLAAGVGLLFACDAAPVPLKNIGLGAIADFLVWEPLMVEGLRDDYRNQAVAPAPLGSSPGPRAHQARKMHLH